MLIDHAVLSKQLVAAAATAVVTATFYQWAPPVNPVKDAVKDSYWRSWIFSFINVSTLAVWVFALWYIFAAYSPARTPWTPGELAAATAALGGGLLRIWAMRTLDYYFTFQVTIREDHKLIETGPYRWLLHPSYSGIVAGVSGLVWLLQGPGWLPVTCRTPWVWALAVPVAGFVLVARVKDEEAVLAGHFGSAWERYKSSRWRLVPFIW